MGTLWTLSGVGCKLREGLLGSSCEEGKGRGSTGVLNSVGPEWGIKGGKKGWNVLGLGWAGVNFLPRGCFRAVLGCFLLLNLLFTNNKNTEMFLLLLNSKLFYMISTVFYIICK